MKKLLSLMLATVMLLAVVPTLTVYGADIVDSGYTSDIPWTLDDEGTLIISRIGGGVMSSYSPTRLAPWYNNRSYIKKVIIGDGIVDIGSYAFYGCTNLTSVSIPDSVLSIGVNAFSGCTSLTSMTIPDGVSAISMQVFSGCSNLESIDIPGSVKHIGERTFSGCTSLASITIPDSVTSIGEGTFYGCTSLTSATIPNSVTSIGNYAFYSCASLASITIPDSVTSIGEGTFYGCTSLASVTISDLDAWCKIKFEDIHANPLWYAKNLYIDGELAREITIPDSMMSIGNSAFSGCTSLASITIPDSVTSIGSSAFSGCTSLTDVYYGGTKAQWDNIAGSSDYVLTNTIIHYGYVDDSPSSGSSSGIYTSTLESNHYEAPRYEKTAYGDLISATNEYIKACTAFKKAVVDGLEKEESESEIEEKIRKEGAAELQKNDKGTNDKILNGLELIPAEAHEYCYQALYDMIAQASKDAIQLQSIKTNKDNVRIGVNTAA